MILIQSLRALGFTAVACAVAACSSNPHKARKIETKLEQSAEVTGDERVGVNTDGDMVVRKKVAMNEELRRLQYEVYELEDRVYGNRKYGSKGLYGTLRDCRGKLARKENGGDGKLMWTEPMDRVTDKEEEFKVGVDERNKLVAVSEEFLADRIARFRDYKMILMKRQDEYDDKVQICRTELASRKFDADKAKADGN